MQQLPLLILAVLLVAWPAPALSRHHEPATDTETLDVAESLSRARAAVSTDALPLHQSLAAPGRLTLHLHSRDFLPSEQGRHANYKSLVLARLRRDSARAAAVSARASLAADGLKSSDLLPSDTSPLFSASAADMQGPVVSGVGQGSGEYFSIYHTQQWRHSISLVAAEQDPCSGTMHSSSAESIRVCDRPLIPISSSLLHFFCNRPPLLLVLSSPPVPGASLPSIELHATEVRDLFELGAAEACDLVELHQHVGSRIEWRRPPSSVPALGLARARDLPSRRPPPPPPLAPAAWSGCVHPFCSFFVRAVVWTTG